MFKPSALLKNVSGQGLQTYYFGKIQRLNKLNLNILEEKAIEFVVHGVQNEQISMSLTRAKKMTIPNLTRYLESLHCESIRNSKGKQAIGKLQRGGK